MTKGEWRAEIFAGMADLENACTSRAANAHKKIAPAENRILAAFDGMRAEAWNEAGVLERRVEELAKLLDRAQSALYLDGGNDELVIEIERALVTDSATSAHVEHEVSGVTPMPGTGLEPVRDCSQGILRKSSEPNGDPAAQQLSDDSAGEDGEPPSRVVPCPATSGHGPATNSVTSRGASPEVPR